MHIAIDVSAAAEDLRTGVGVYTINLLRALSEIDHANKYSIYSVRFNQELKEICRSNFRLRKIPDLVPLHSQWYSWSLWHYTGFSLQLMKDKPDVFISTQPSLPMFCLSRKLIVIHDLTPLILKDAYTKRFRTIFRSQLLHATRLADRILTVSNSTKNDLVNILGIDSKIIDVVYQSYDREAYSNRIDIKQLENVKQKYKIPQRYIFYVGTREPKKNIARLIEAYNMLINQHSIDHRLVIAGKGNWRDEELFSLVVKLGIKDHIIFTGFISNEELPLLLSGADLFVFPSLHEGFGIPLLEAMACGTPVITSNLSSLPEVVADAALLVDPYNVNAISNAMYTLLSDHVLRKELKEKGLIRVKQFSWEKTGKEILRIIETLT